MSTFVTSRRTRAQHVPPRHDRPYRPSPARRQFIHGKVQGIPDRRDPTARLFIALALVVALVFAVQLARPLLGHHAASDVRSPASGSTAPSIEAGRR